MSEIVLGYFGIVIPLITFIVQFVNSIYSHKKIWKYSSRHEDLFSKSLVATVYVIIMSTFAYVSFYLVNNNAISSNLILVLLALSNISLYFFSSEIPYKKLPSDHIISHLIYKRIKQRNIAFTKAPYFGFALAYSLYSIINNSSSNVMFSYPFMILVLAMLPYQTIISVNSLRIEDEYSVFFIETADNQKHISFEIYENKDSYYIYLHDITHPNAGTKTIKKVRKEDISLFVERKFIIDLKCKKKAAAEQITEFEKWRQLIAESKDVFSS